jgi:hypothetical protein
MMEDGRIGETFNSTLYKCSECHYSTMNRSNFNKHQKTNKCLGSKLIKKQLKFIIKDNQIAELFDNDCGDDDTLESAGSGSSTSSYKSDDVVIKTKNEYVSGSIHYIFNNVHPKMAIITMTKTNEPNTYDFYKDIFQEPVIISVYTPDITDVESFVRSDMRTANLVDKDYIMHSEKSISSFIKYSIAYNSTLDH